MYLWRQQSSPRQNVHLALVYTRPSSESLELSCPKYTTNLAQAYGCMTLVWITTTRSCCCFSSLFKCSASRAALPTPFYIRADQNHSADARRDEAGLSSEQFNTGERRVGFKHAVTGLLQKRVTLENDICEDYCCDCRTLLVTVTLQYSGGYCLFLQEETLFIYTHCKYLQYINVTVNIYSISTLL